MWCAVVALQLGPFLKCLLLMNVGSLMPLKSVTTCAWSWVYFHLGSFVQLRLGGV